jgi:ABC-type transport system involved in cytochrome c biogenesis permease subunit
MIAAAGYGSGKNLVPPQWQSWLTKLHLVLAIAGEALFVLATAASAMFIIQNSLLKRKKPGKMGKLLPSLGELDRINHLGLLWGFSLLTVGMIAGAVYAAFVWGGRWACDFPSHLVLCRSGRFKDFASPDVLDHWLEGIPGSRVLSCVVFLLFLFLGPGDQGFVATVPIIFFENMIAVVGLFIKTARSRA